MKNAPTPYWPTGGSSTPASPFPRERAVRDLHQHAGAVAHQRVGADRAAMGQVFQHAQAVGDDLVGACTPFMCDDEADAAGIMLVARVVKPLALRQAAGLRKKGILR